jgi:CPA2 family monovalent cation:H+ antiporter-2
VLFFVSIGLLLDPMQLVNSPGLIAATLAIILIGKPLAAFLIVIALRYPLKTALCVSVALAQIGEFSFILASLAEHEGILPKTAMGALVPAAIISITLNPLLYRTIDPLERFAIRYPFWRRRLAPTAKRPLDPDAETSLDEPQRAVIVGYGPVGRTVARLLKENEVTPVVIELNLDTVRKLRAANIEAVYGDSQHRDTLITAGVPLADSLILSSAGMHGVQEVIRLARELNPDIHVVARAGYLQERASLRAAGADQVFSGEGEVALALNEAILNRLGATPDQIDRERARVRADLFGTGA